MLENISTKNKIFIIIKDIDNKEEDINLNPLLYIPTIFIKNTIEFPLSILLMNISFSTDNIEEKTLLDEFISICENISNIRKNYLIGAILVIDKNIYGLQNFKEETWTWYKYKDKTITSIKNNKCLYNKEYIEKIEFIYQHRNFNIFNL